MYFRSYPAEGKINPVLQHQVAAPCVHYRLHGLPNGIGLVLISLQG